MNMDNNYIINVVFRDCIEHIEDMICGQLEDTINDFKKLYKDVCFKVLINLDNVNVAIPAIVNIILKIHKITIDSGGEIEIKRPPKHVEEVLIMTKIDQLIKII